MSSDVQQKLAELTRLYDDIQHNISERSSALEDTLGVAEKFWDDLHLLAGNIKDIQEGLANQEKPALEPEVIREQQEELEVRTMHLFPGWFYYILSNNLYLV